MVDVSDKPVQHRGAIAVGELHCAPATILALKASALPKGDVLAVARIAGIQAAKRTAELIPLCHSLPLFQVTVNFVVKTDRISILAGAITEGKTRKDGGRDGSVDGGECGRTHALRHDESRRQRHAH